MDHASLGQGGRIMGLMGTRAAAVAALLALCGGVAVAETTVPGGKLTVELNKFEDIAGGGCRTYFLFKNDTGASFEGFQMSLAIFDKDGVIDRLLSVDAAPLPVARTTLKLFEIPQIACANVSQILLHDVPVCKPQNAENTDCYPLMDLSSKTPAPLVK